jgi:DNA-binding HxlR family transcriptional regulator
MREIYYGTSRYDDFQRNLGLSRNTLSDRLNKLVAAGVLTKRLYQDNPPRNEYLLTDMGREFFPILAALAKWGDRWLDKGKGKPVALLHTECGHELAAEVICADCGLPVSADSVEFHIGPGYPSQVPDYLDLRPRLKPAIKTRAASKSRCSGTNRQSGRTASRSAKA